MKGYVEKQIVDLGDHGEQIEQYGIFESTERAEGNVIGIFSCEETRIRVKAFVLDEEEVMVRFRPERTGIWEYRIQAGETILREVILSINVFVSTVTIRENGFLSYIISVPC